MRIQTLRLPWILLLGPCLCLCCAVILAGPGDGRGTVFVPFQAFDDWDIADPNLIPLLLQDHVFCTGGETPISPEQPCPPGVNTKMRHVMAPGSMFSADPRMIGSGIWSASANFDPDYSGSVWGTWSLEVDGDGGVWEGTWSGQRHFSMDAMECMGFTPCWIGELKIVGHGSGGIVEGLHVKALERITTFTPLPVPYENLCLMLGDPCPLEGIPEGILTGYILEPGR